MSINDMSDDILRVIFVCHSQFETCSLQKLCSMRRVNTRWQRLMNEEHCGRNQAAFINRPLFTINHIDHAANMNTAWAWTVKNPPFSNNTVLAYAITHPTLRIGHVDCPRASQSVLNIISTIPHLERISIGSSEFKDLTPLLQCKSLVYLDLGECDDIMDMDCLTEIPTLRLLSINSAPRLRSLASIAAATNITALSLRCCNCPVAQGTKGLGRKRLNSVSTTKGTKWPKVLLRHNKG